MTEQPNNQEDDDTPKDLGGDTPEELQALVELERDELARRPPEWDEVAAGKLTVEEAAARIRKRSAQTEEEIAEAAALFAPPNNGFERSLVDRLTGMRPAAETPSNVVQVPANRWRVPLIAGVAAVAAAVLLWWGSSAPSDTVAPSDDRIAIAVPAHEMWIEKTAEVRGEATDDAPELEAGSTMTFFLRPNQAYAADPVVWACAEHDGERRPLQVRHERHGNVVEVRADLPADMRAGLWQLLAFVSHAQAPASACDAEASETVRVKHHGFVIAPR